MRLCRHPRVGVQGVCYISCCVSEWAANGECVWPCFVLGRESARLGVCRGGGGGMVVGSETPLKRLLFFTPLPSIV
jgi:hypothetical protein